jgi:hypothetical protein
VGAAEAQVAASAREAFEIDATGMATLRVGERSWCAGRFATPSIGERQAQLSAGRGGRESLWVFVGGGPVTDIGALQATAGGSPLFQVASQFNCLKSPGEWIVPVACYDEDSTQGPRAAFSAFPAALQRHYAAPGRDGVRFQQATDRQQIDLLADVFTAGHSPVHNGYLVDDGGLGGEVVARALEERFDAIRIGVHEDAEVAFGYDWYGAMVGDEPRLITQCLTSTVAASYGGRAAFGPAFERVCRQLLRAGYLGTLLSAIVLDRSPVVLTLVGGGAFGNPVGLIWDAIVWAFDRARSHAIRQFDVIVNARNLDGSERIQSVLADVRSRRGAVLAFDRDGLAWIEA